ncbi:MAG: NUDIX hydrolase [Candidatus Gracilibacteria bacterium]|nr:NUDIX hydrolase [Candidatus Gracilibacteria bacterium]
MKNKIIVNAVMVFVFDSLNNVLLLKRLDNEKWEAVKGGIEDGENYIDAARRELKEETGIETIDNVVLHKIVKDEMDKPNGDVLEINGHVTFCHINETSPKITLGIGKDLEHSEYKWLSVKEIENEDLHPNIANKIIKEIVKFKK